MMDEMYLRKLEQYFAGKLVGENEEEELYSGIVCFMIVGLKQSIPFVVKSCPETTVTGAWLKERLDECISELAAKGFKVRAVVADNHKSNVSAFNSMFKSYDGEENLSIFHPAYDRKMKTYLFYDMVHIMKNVRNNLLGSKKFVFPEFTFDKFRDRIHVPEGNLSWSLLHRVREADERLDAGLKKAHKINHSVLHPGNNKQDVGRALAIFHETTSAAIKSYFPEREDAANFLNVFHKLFLVCNAKTPTHGSDSLGDAARPGDHKVEFLRAVANWIENWSNISDFSLTTATGKAIVTTLRAEACLIEDLFSEGYRYVLTVRFQSDALERRFSRYRQMNGGNFLVSLREVQSSEKILLLCSMVKEGINFWEDDSGVYKEMDQDSLMNFHVDISEMANEITSAELSSDSQQVSANVAGYIARQLQERIDCSECASKVEAKDHSTIHNSYINLLSRGGLKHPSVSLAEFIASAFAILDLTSPVITRYSVSTDSTLKTNFLALEVLNNYNNNVNFSCETHRENARKIASRAVVNVFFNNKRKEKSAQVRKQAVGSFKTRQRKKKAMGEE